MMCANRSSGFVCPNFVGLFSNMFILMGGTTALKLAQVQTVEKIVEIPVVQEVQKVCKG